MVLVDIIYRAYGSSCVDSLLNGIHESILKAI